MIGHFLESYDYRAIVRGRKIPSSWLEDSAEALKQDRVFRKTKRSIIFQLEDTGEQQRGKNKQASEH